MTETISKLIADLIEQLLAALREVVWELSGLAKNVGHRLDAAARELANE